MPTIDDEDRTELAALVRGVREHLMWLERGGINGVPRATEPSTAVEAPARGKARTDAATHDAAVRMARPATTAPPTTLGNEVPPGCPLEAEPQGARDRAAPQALAMPIDLVRGSDGGGQGLLRIRSDLGDCQRCKLAGGRRNIVFGVGNPEAALVFVGEGPGEEEDRQGEPFVGKAGQLLDKMIAAMGLDRGEVYICNVVKCRPPQNRAPEPDEVAACLPFLERQLQALGPRLLVTLGKTAAATLLKTNAPISRYRGQFHTYNNIPLMPTWHPAYLLRTPSAKREAWEDLQKVMAELDRMGIPRRQAPAPAR